MTAIKGFLSLDFSYFWGLVSFGLGILTGIVAISLSFEEHPVLNKNKVIIITRKIG